jgi:hypothetical protein
MCPLIGTVEDAEAFVQAVKYPPRGNRSWGPYRARLDHDGDYFKTANDWTIACPQIETRGALDRLDEILALDGVDMVCFGPNDLSVALTGRLDIWAPEVKEAMTLVLSKCREVSVIALFLPTTPSTPSPVAEGWDGCNRHRRRLVREGRRRGQGCSQEQLLADARPTLCQDGGKRVGAFHAVADSNLGICRAGRVRRWGRRWPTSCFRSIRLIPIARLLPKADWYTRCRLTWRSSPPSTGQALFHDGAERNRYRYMPHIFHGYSDDGEGYLK